MKNTLNILIASIAFTGSALAQDMALYQKAHFVKNGDTMHYRIMYPKKFSEHKSYPLVIFLHGAGERGKDNESQLKNGGALFSNKQHRSNYPAIVIFPQCPKEDFWANKKAEYSSPWSISFHYDQPPTKALSLLENLVHTFLEKSFVDKSRVYIGGLSMGSMGTFEMLYRNPNIFAAAFAICGGGDEAKVVEKAGAIPIWIFHGAKDDVISPKLSIDMVAAYLKAGYHPNFNLYGNDNHNSWDSAFAEPKLLKWLFHNAKH